MIKRNLQLKLQKLLQTNPAVVLMGPRQVGKTTLSFELVNNNNAIYLDLERPSDLAKISDIEAYCQLHSEKLLILDEVQRAPELFAPIRSIIDERRRKGLNNNQFLFLGSASIELLKQSSETLAGRIAYCELHPFNAIESKDITQLWNRGGFPNSFLANNDIDSLAWRDNFIATYLARDIPQLGPRIPSETLRRFWTMLAFNQGQTFKPSSLARGLDVKGITVSRYLDLMVDLLLVRRLPQWTSNIGRRLVKAPKTYVRDSGVCHALLGIEVLDTLLGHPVVGGSWEGFVIENICSVLPRSASIGYYRTVGGAEIDLVVKFASGELWAIEIKRSSAPKLSRGFHSACDDLKPTKKIVLHSGVDDYPIAKGIEAMTLPSIIEKLN